MHDSQHAPGFYELIKKYHIEKYVIFHGQKMNEELDELFNEADFAIGSQQNIYVIITILRQIIGFGGQYPFHSSGDMERGGTIGDSDHRREYYRLFITFIICSFHDRFLMESLILRGDRSSSI